MKTKELKEVKLPEGFIVDPALTGKYDKEPFFMEKAEKARQILQKYPITRTFFAKQKVTMLY